MIPRAFQADGREGEWPHHPHWQRVYYNPWHQVRGQMDVKLLLLTPYACFRPSSVQKIPEHGKGKC